MEEGFIEDSDMMFDEVTGARNKRSVMSALNKKKIGKHDLDEIFDDFF